MTAIAVIKYMFGGAMILHRRLLNARAADVTVSCADKRALVFAPHPDDETLGCGATIIRKRDAGTEVFVVVAADGRFSHRSDTITPEQLSAIRRDEATRACATLGVPPDHVTFLDYPDLQLCDHVPELTRQAAALLARTKPSEIYAPIHFDSHPDHRALNEAVRLAAADADFSGTILEYPIWMEAPGAWFDHDAAPLVKAGQTLSRPLLSLFRLRPVIVRSAGVSDRKRAAIADYRSQVSNLTDEADWAVLDERFLRRFTERDEMFFKVIV